jgi:hypothetical protein
MRKREWVDMHCELVQDILRQARESGQQGKKILQSRLEPPRRARAEHRPHHQAQIEASCVNQEAFEDIRVAAEVGASHAPGLVQVREGAFDQLAPHSV